MSRGDYFLSDTEAREEWEVVCKTIEDLTFAKKKINQSNQKKHYGLELLNFLTKEISQST